MTDGNIVRPGARGGAVVRDGHVAAGGGRAPANLGDILERVLDKGLVIAGDIQVNLLDIELLTIKLRLVIASLDTAREVGINWWEADPWLSADAGRRQAEGQSATATGNCATRSPPARPGARTGVGAMSIANVVSSDAGGRRTDRWRVAGARTAVWAYAIIDGHRRVDVAADLTWLDRRRRHAGARRRVPPG